MATRVARGKQSIASRSLSIVVVRRVRIGFVAVPGETAAPLYRRP
jgi:hypothetical protein